MRMATISENEGSATFNEIEIFIRGVGESGSLCRPGFVGFPWRDRWSLDGIHIDEDVPATLNEMFALAGAEHITLWHRRYLPKQIKEIANIIFSKCLLRVRSRHVRRKKRCPLYPG